MNRIKEISFVLALGFLFILTVQLTLSISEKPSAQQRIPVFQEARFEMSAHPLSLIKELIATELFEVKNQAFLNDLQHRIVAGGLLVISSPYTLLEEYTPKSNWIGGLQENGEARTVLQGMQTVLAPHFQMVRAPLDVPFVIRETSRKFQHSIAEMTVWERKSI